MVTPTKRTFTPKRQLSGKPMKFRGWDEYSIGDILIVKYVKTTPNKFNVTKPNHVVEIIETFLKDKKVQKEWTEGTHVCLNTMGMLDKALDEIVTGTIVQITYNGKNMIEKGKMAGKEAHAVEVIEVSDDNETEKLSYEEESDDEDMDL